MFSFMRQPPNVPKQEGVEVAPVNVSDWSVTPNINLNRQLQTELQLERCLNQLGDRLSEHVTSFLATPVDSLDVTGLDVEVEMYQALAQSLETALQGTQIAIFQKEQQNELVEGCDRSSRVYKCIYPTSSNVSPVIAFPLIGTSKETVKFEPGETLTLHNLQDLQAHNPETVWKISDDQEPMGWLLLHRSSASSPPNPLDSDSFICRLIARSLNQCARALRQINLICGQRQQQQALFTHNHELIQTNQLKSEFLANTSHEIRTPLSSILGFTHLLKAQGYSPTNLRHQEYLNIILSSGQHLLALINDILDLSKIEANQLDLSWEIVEVEAVCQTTLALVKEKASDKGLALKLEIMPQVTTLIADSLRLKQMLFNLLSNAIKFTLRGGVGIQVVSADNYLHFTVWDTGIGILPEQQKLLFRPYSQIANTAVGREQGTGLGLALTQKLAELQGGWVNVVSEAGKGSRFTVSLPLVPPMADDRDDAEIAQLFDGQDVGVLALDLESPTTVLSRPSQSEHRTPRSSHEQSSYSLESTTNSTSQASDMSFSEVVPRCNHLLLVEDNVHNAKLMLTFLSKSGYEVTWVKEGSEMWAALERSLPALILMDIHLPHIDGLTLIKQLKIDHRYQAIPVIAQTAMAMSGDRDLCLEAGATNYISKPIDLDALSKLVGQYVWSEEKR